MVKIQISYFVNDFAIESLEYQAVYLFLYFRKDDYYFINIIISSNSVSTVDQFEGVSWQINERYFLVVFCVIYLPIFPRLASYK